MSVSVYKLIFKDTDFKKLAPSSKLEIGTYTTDKTKVIGLLHITCGTSRYPKFKGSDIPGYKQ